MISGAVLATYGLWKFVATHQVSELLPYIFGGATVLLVVGALFLRYGLCIPCIIEKAIHHGATHRGTPKLLCIHLSWLFLLYWLSLFPYITDARNYACVIKLIIGAIVYYLVMNLVMLYFRAVYLPDEHKKNRRVIAFGFPAILFLFGLVLQLAGISIFRLPFVRQSLLLAFAFACLYAIFPLIKKLLSGEALPPVRSTVRTTFSTVWMMFFISFVIIYLNYLPTCKMAPPGTHAALGTAILILLIAITLFARKGLYFLLNTRSDERTCATLSWAIVVALSVALPFFATRYNSGIFWLWFLGFGVCVYAIFTATLLLIDYFRKK